MEAKQVRASQEISVVQEAVTTAAEAHQVIDPSFKRPPSKTILWITTNGVTVQLGALKDFVHKEWLGGHYRQD
eukprot:2926905-Karenia_brevis.AAC.1